RVPATGEAAGRGVPEAHGPALPGHGAGRGEGPPRGRRQGRDRGHGPGVSAVAISVWVRLLRVHGLLLRQVRRSVPEHLTLPRCGAAARPWAARCVRWRYEARVRATA